MKLHRGALAAGAFAIHAALVGVACTDDPATDAAPEDAGSEDATIDSSPPPVAAEAGSPRDAAVDESPPTIECAVTPCVLDIATAGSSTCALLADGTVSCWGSNEYGQLGRGAMDAGQDGLPAPVIELSSVTQLSGAVNGYCARTSDGSVACWGDNRAGQVDAADTEPWIDVPRTIEGLPKASAAFMGDELGCAALESGDAMCWGKNTDGRFPALLDAGAEPQGPTKIDLGGRPVSALVPGKSAVVALMEDGELVSWGRRSRPLAWQVNGLGREIALDFGTPGALPYPTEATRLSGWGDGVAAISLGRALRWGAVDHSEGPVLPTAVPLGTTATVLWISFGEGGQLCVVLSDESVRCIGGNAYGQLGTGEYSTREIVAREVMELPAPPARVVTSAYHACAVLVTGAAFCWGNNLRGQLGSGDFALHPTPTLVRFTP